MLVQSENTATYICHYLVCSGGGNEYVNAAHLILNMLKGMHMKKPTPRATSPFFCSIYRPRDDTDDGYAT